MRKTSTVPDLRQEEPNPWRESLEQRLRERMRELIEHVLEEEVEEALGAARSQRAAGRCGYRHGVKPRRLVLRGGAVQVAVPRARSVTPGGEEREWQSRLVPRYRRATPEVEQAVLGVYLVFRVRRLYDVVNVGPPPSEGIGCGVLVDRLAVQSNAG